MLPNDDKIRAFGSDDNLKALGELLSNDTSRKIISALMKQEMYTNEISTKLDMRVSLVIHHLKKMEELGLLDITNKKIIRRGQEHRFFKMNFDIFITLKNTKEDIKEKGFLKRIFRDGIKFASIGLAAFFIWTQTKVTKNSINDGDWPTLDVNTIDIPFYEDETFFPMLAIILFLIANMVYGRLRKKRFGH